MGRETDFGDYSIDRILTKDFLKTAAPRAKEIIAGCEIRGEDFGNYDRDQIRRDMEVGLSSRNRRESSEKEALAIVATAIILEQVRAGKWFGEGVLAIKTSSYDESRGIRLVIEFQRKDGTSWLALATDIVFGEDLGDILGATEEKIRRGDLGRIKYFYSERSGVKGELGLLPEAAIAVKSKRALIELGQLYFFDEGHKDAIREKEARLFLFYQQILKGLQVQLEGFSNLADEFVGRKGGLDLGNRIVVAGAYKKALGTIEDLIRKTIHA
jgi:hypothetical protein